MEFYRLLPKQISGISSTTFDNFSHSGMQYITPMQKRTGEHHQIFATRNMTLCNAKERFPSRWGKRSTRVFNVKEQEI